jgi:hypothetical protein
MLESWQSLEYSAKTKRQDLTEIERLTSFAIVFAGRSFPMTVSVR